MNDKWSNFLDVNFTKKMERVNLARPFMDCDRSDLAEQCDSQGRHPKSHVHTHQTQQASLSAPMSSLNRERFLMFLQQCQHQVKTERTCDLSTRIHKRPLYKERALHRRHGGRSVN